MQSMFSLAAVTLLAFASAVRADSPPALYVLAIGYNGVPAATTDATLRELRYADDDAAAFAQLAQDLGGTRIVLSTFDVDTARRFPNVAREVRPPVGGELTRAVSELNADFARDRAQGRDSTVIVTYSGHGTVDGGVPELTLADGSLTHETLYSEVLTKLHASFVHLVIDACHAEAVVRPRDVQADVVTLRPDEMASHLSQATLRGLPNVGALIASSASLQTHEWDAWQHGVFTHEVISGLRGAADVNGDLRIEYSEMAAFLSAANREVRDRRARLRPIVTAPAAAPRAPLVVLHASARSAFLAGDAEPLGKVSVETDDGQLVFDLRSEHQYYVRVLVPSGRRLFVRTRDAETEVTVPAGKQLSFAALGLRPSAMRARGSLALSLQSGLFATAYGPAYYRGYVDRADEPAVIPLAESDLLLKTDTPRVDAASSRAPAWTALGVAGALLGASAVSGVVALNAKSEFNAAHGLERQSAAADQRFNQSRSLALGALIGGAVAGCRLAIVLGFHPRALVWRRNIRAGSRSKYARQIRSKLVKIRICRPAQAQEMLADALVCKTLQPESVPELTGDIFREVELSAAWDAVADE